MAANGDSRDERRRRIVERGTDRLALITGRISNLPPSPSSTVSSHDHQIQQTTISDQINGVAAGLEAVDDASASALLKEESTNVVSRGCASEIGYQVEPQAQHSETIREAIQAPFVDMPKIQPSPRTSIIPKESNDEHPLTIPCRHQPTFFSSKRLNSCIIASEGTRSFCALMIALLVVLSYVDYPLFGVNIVRSEGIMASRPVYIILLTDVTIVLTQMYLETRRGSEVAEEEKSVHRGDGEIWGGAIKVLERGLVVYQAIRGVFIDCSVYAVVVVCGLSLV
ncbi:hypothetical protein CFOL_v3_16175 [Cephalotus follicularis]|uniref:Uncharacterized protein n=1 Tax=Cephalotus follicularis TaxID=3775 RepID=A0A1Q3BXH2_CEPFO|nr:hypothetical protein CFOL_v3_16175 [Cephalotus follicularis]